MPNEYEAEYIEAVNLLKPHIGVLEAIRRVLILFECRYKVNFRAKFSKKIVRNKSRTHPVYMKVSP